MDSTMTSRRRRRVVKPLPSLADWCRAGESSAPEVVYEWKHWLVDGLFPARQRITIIGLGGSDKTIILCCLAICAASGTEFLGRGVQQGSVLYINEDEPTELLELKLNRFALGAGHRSWRDLPITLHSYGTLQQGWGAAESPGPFVFDRKPGVNRVKELAEELQPTLIVFESAGSMGGKMNENDTLFGRRIGGILKEIMACSPGSTAILTHNAAKGELASLEACLTVDVTRASRGTGALVDKATDTAFITYALTPEEYVKILPNRFALIPKPRRTAIPAGRVLYIEMKEPSYGKGAASLEGIDLPTAPAGTLPRRVFKVFSYTSEMGGTDATLSAEDVLFYLARRYSPHLVEKAFDELEAQKVLIEVQREDGATKRTKLKFRLSPNYAEEADPFYLESLDIKDDYVQ